MSEYTFVFEIANEIIFRGNVKHEEILNIHSSNALLKFKNLSIISKNSHTEKNINGKKIDINNSSSPLQLTFSGFLKGKCNINKHSKDYKAVLDFFALQLNVKYLIKNSLAIEKLYHCFFKDNVELFNSKINLNNLSDRKFNAIFEQGEYEKNKYEEFARKFNVLIKR